MDTWKKVGKVNGENRFGDAKNIEDTIFKLNNQFGVDKDAWESFHSLKVCDANLCDNEPLFSSSVPNKEIES